MNSAASTALAPPAPASQRPSVTRRSGLQFLVALLLAAGIPVVATVHILDSNALGNERARADSALRTELQSAGQTLARLGEDASNHADDLSRSPAVQRAFLTDSQATLRRLARRTPGIVFYLQGTRVAGKRPRVSLTRSVSLTLNGRRVGTVEATIGLGRRLDAQLLHTAPHGREDKLLVVRKGNVIASRERFRIDGQTVRLGPESYRGALAPVPNATGVSLLALRPEGAIEASVRPYQRQVQYAAAGSFALLVLLGLIFGRPLVRMLGDFRNVASQAVTDPLTGIANRRSFDEELALEWRRAERVGETLSLVLLDIDNFKRVNDTHGHQQGDAVLREVAAVLRAGVRQVDLAARYGGEEFALVLPETTLADAVTVAERLRGAVERIGIELEDGTTLPVTASFGVAEKSDRERGEDLVAAADESLYEAKRAGKNRVAPVAVAASAPEAPAPELPERRRKAAAKKPAAKKAAAKTASKQPARKKAAPARRSTKPKSASA